MTEVCGQLHRNHVDDEVHSVMPLYSQRERTLNHQLTSAQVQESHFIHIISGPFVKISTVSTYFNVRPHNVSPCVSLPNIHLLTVNTPGWSAQVKSLRGNTAHFTNCELM